VGPPVTVPVVAPTVAMVVSAEVQVAATGEVVPSEKVPVAV